MLNEKQSTEHVKWVPWPSEEPVPIGARIRAEYVTGKYMETLATFVHPDDVPALDAELVEKVAASIEPLVLGGKAVAQTHAAWCRDVARAAIAVIRDTSEVQS